jgi:cytochrome c biogenesis protein CcdA
MSKFIEITGLALADSVNPCAIAVLTMVLVAILVANPEKKKKVLSAGLAFSAAVFIGYMIYAGILYQVFHLFAESLAKNSGTFKIIFGSLAILIGALNIKDSIFYKAGSIGTEMPLFLRPKAKRTINKITSPGGAFIIGFIVTLFLLPCTAGPLVIATGILSDLTWVQVIPWLLYYTFLFVLPMIIITLIVFFGLTRVQDVSAWKEKNIKKLHLIAGILLVLVGAFLLIGWI